MHFYENLFDHSPDGIVLAHRSGALLRVNDAACRMLGYARDEFLRLTRADLIVDPLPTIAAVTAPDRPELLKREVTLRRADGSTIPVELTSVRIDGADDDQLHSFAILRDISERRSLERARELEIARFRAFFDSLGEGVAFLEPVRDSHGRISSFFRADANTTFDRLTGNTSGQPRSLHDVEGEDIESRMRIFRSVLETGEPVEYERELYGRRLRVRIVRQGADLLGVMVADRTAELLATEAQRASDAKAAASAEELSAVLDAVPAAVWIARDARADDIHGNRFGAEFLRAKQDANLSLSAPEHERPRAFTAMFGDRVADPDELPLQRSSRRGEVLRDVEFDLLFEDGERRHMLGNSQPLHDATGRVTGAVAAFVDITERKQNEQALATAIARFDAFMSASPAATFMKDADGRFVFANEMAEQCFGIPRAAWIGRTVSDLFDARLAARMLATDEQVLRTGQPVAYVQEVQGPGEAEVRYWRALKFPIRDASGRIGIGGISDDVTAEKLAEDALRESEARARQAQHDLELSLEQNRKTEEKFRQSQKMEAIGRLAGGVAHDFNNLLTIILGNAEILTRALKGDPLADDVLEIAKAGERAASLTQQLLAFSRRQPLEPRLINLNDTIANTQRMLARTLGEDVELKLILSQALNDCLVDPGQMEQVLLNLVVNARDAMPDGGQLTIETSNVYLDKDYVDAHPEARVGPHVLLSVSDSGVGMSPEVQARLFEPFFTTKALGKGTGLGLSTVYGIVQQSGGTLWVYSEVGHGTTMKVYLPVATSGEPATTTPSVEPRSLKGSESILLVEDDAKVRATIARMLRLQGYNVIEASNGGEALLICEQHGGKIDLLLTDIVMPRMNGRQLADRLRLVRAGLRVIYMSGYTENVVVHHGVVDAGVEFLAKPITTERLLPKIRDVLDRA